MANVKITDLTELAAVDLATVDVLPIVDIDTDVTKKVTIASLTGLSDANDFVTYTQLNANIDVVSGNVASTETRLNANLDIVQDNVAAISVTLGIRGDGGTNDDVTVGTEELVFLGDTGITTTVSSNTVTIDLDDTAVSAGLYGGVSGGVTNVAAVTIDATGRITNAANISVVTNLDTLQDNINVLDGNADAIATDVTALEARRAANVILSDAEDTALQARLTTNVAITTAVEARRVANVTIMNDEDTALQARIAANTLVAAANDFVTFTRLQANIDLVQDNVTTASGGSDGVEARRVANIAGAVSTITTGNLTASRALASDGSGKVAVATTTLAELNHISGVTAAVQTQLDAVEARRAANNITTTFTDDVTITGNLTINGDTTTVSTTNLDVEDRIIMLADGVTGSPSADVGLLFNRGNQGNAAFFYDESGKTFKLSDTKDPKSNTSLSPVTASNLSVGIIDAATVKFNGTSVQDAISANVTTLTNEDTALQSRLTTNVTAFTNEDTALQARITANATITTAVEARRVANIAGAISSVLTGDLTADRVMITNGSGKIAASSGVTPTELGYLDGITLGTVAASKAVTADANGDVTFIREVDIDGNVVIGTNASNTVTIVGKLDLGAFS